MLTLNAKLYMESFSLNEKKYVAFHLLDETIKGEFAQNIKDRIFEFLQQVEANTTGIKVLFPQVYTVSVA